MHSQWVFNRIIMPLYTVGSTSTVQVVECMFVIFYTFIGIVYSVTAGKCKLSIHQQPEPDLRILTFWENNNIYNLTRFQPYTFFLVICKINYNKLQTDFKTAYDLLLFHFYRYALVLHDWSINSVYHYANNSIKNAHTLLQLYTIWVFTVLKYVVFRNTCS